MDNRLRSERYIPMAAEKRMVASKPNGKKDATQYSSSLRRRRQHWGQKASMLVFLTIAVLLSFSLTLGEIGERNGGEPKTGGSERDSRLNGKGSTDDAPLERHPTRTGRTTTTKINIVDPTHNLLELLSSPRSNKVQHRIWIVLAYGETCEYSEKLLRKLIDHAIPRIQFNNDDSNDNRKIHPPEMNFVRMPIDDKEVGLDWKKEFLNRIGIARLPSLFFIRDEEQEREYNLLLENAFATAEVYRGRSESISDLVNGLYHYLSRLQFRPSTALENQEHHQSGDRSSPLASVRVESLRELQSIIRNANEYKILQSPPLPLDPDLSEHDEKWIRYLMDDDSGTTNCRSDFDSHYFDTNDKIKHPEEHEETYDEVGSCPQDRSNIRDSYHAIIQCRNYRGNKAQRTSSPHSIVQLYQEYNQAIKVLGPRRDTLFSILEPRSEGMESNELSGFCDSPSDDGLVRVWNFHSNESLSEFSLDEEREKEFFEEKLNNSTNVITQLSSRLVPDVLWFDRRMTAPIAFNQRYRRHVILFVDFHDPTSASKSRDAIRLFRQECRQLQMEQQLKTNNLQSVLNHTVGEATDGGNDENSFVCLVVPSTEIRVLNTFGIDIWSNLDRQATEKMKTTLCNSQNWKANDVSEYHLCDNFEGREESEVPGSDTSKYSSVLPAMLLTERQKDGAIKRYYLDPPINSRSLNEFVNDFITGRIEPEIKNDHISADAHYATNETYDFPTSKHFINLLTAKSLPHFLKSNRDKHVLVELYAPTCGHCKRFNTIWNSLGRLVDFLGWSDWLLLARIDVTSNEIIVPGMATAWLPDVFYFGVGVTENPIHYGKTPFADDAELGGISDPLELLEWWMDEAADVINEGELLRSLEKMIAGASSK